MLANSNKMFMRNNEYKLKFLSLLRPENRQLKLFQTINKYRAKLLLNIVQNIENSLKHISSLFIIYFVLQKASRTKWRTFYINIKRLKNICTRWECSIVDGYGF